MKVLRTILSLMLVLCLVFPMIPASIADDSSGMTIQRGVHSTVIIDEDPTDGYEGDYVVIYNPSTTASNSLSTGNLTGLIETTVEPNIVPNPDMQELPESEMPIWKIDIDSQLMNYTIKCNS